MLCTDTLTASSKAAAQRGHCSRRMAATSAANMCVHTCAHQHLLGAAKLGCCKTAFSHCSDSEHSIGLSTSRFDSTDSFAAWALPTCLWDCAGPHCAVLPRSVSWSQPAQPAGRLGAEPPPKPAAEGQQTCICRAEAPCSISCEGSPASHSIIDLERMLKKRIAAHLHFYSKVHEAGMCKINCICRQTLAQASCRLPRTAQQKIWSAR